MLALTKRSEYGLIALVHLVDRRGEIVSAREIGDTYQVPRRLLAEVLKALSRAGLLESYRGATGGYALASEPELITVAQAVTAIEDAAPRDACESDIKTSTGWSACEMSSTCPIKTPIQRLRAGIWGLLHQTTLRDLAHPEPVNPFGELINAAQLQTRTLTDTAVQS
jgi:Rrf2 family protein